MLERMYFQLHTGLQKSSKFTTHSVNGAKKTSFLNCTLGILRLMGGLGSKLSGQSSPDMVEVLALFGRPVRLVQDERYLSHVFVEDQEEVDQERGSEKEEEEDGDHGQGQAEEPTPASKFALGPWFDDKDERSQSLARILLELISGGYDRDVAALCRTDRISFLAEEVRLPLPLVKAGPWSKRACPNMYVWNAALPAAGTVVGRQGGHAC